MKHSIFYKFFSKSVTAGATLIAKILPLWKEARVVTTLPPVLYPVTPPVNISTLPEAVSRKFVSEKIIPRRRIFMLENVLVSGAPVVFKNFRIFVPSLPWQRDLPSFRNGYFLLKQWTSKKAIMLDKQVVALAYDEWSATNYYHWIIESLPRLLMIKEKYPDCLLLIPEPAPQFILITAKLMGFENSYLLKRTDVIKVSKLIFPELVYYYEYKETTKLTPQEKEAIAGFKTVDFMKQHALLNGFAEELIVAVKEKIINYYSQKLPFRKIYVSRSKQRTRRLLNEEKVLPILEKYGFEQVYFEEMDFEAQVKLMLETAVLVGVHGANMVNILFMHSQTRVVEMMNKDYINDAYYLLASTTNLKYYSVLCSMADKSITPDSDSVVLNDAHLLVDVQEFEESIVMAIS